MIITVRRCAEFGITIFENKISIFSRLTERRCEILPGTSFSSSIVFNSAFVSLFDSRRAGADNRQNANLHMVNVTIIVVTVAYVSYVEVDGMG